MVAQSPEPGAHVSLIHQCGPGSMPGLDVICGLSLLLVLFSAPRGFSPGTPVFPSPQKPTFLNSNSIRNARAFNEEPRKVPFLIILSDGCYTQFPVRILPLISCMLAGVRLAVIGSDLHRGDETILNFATVC